jgi:hypothetical protein
MSDSPAVKIWRDKWRKNLNIGRREDIDATITDLKLWQQVLDNWGYVKDGKWVSFNPLAVGHQLSEYERLEQKQPRHASSDTSGVRPEHLPRDG